MNLLFALYIIFYAQLSNAAHIFRSITHSKHSLSARSSGESSRSLITTPESFLALSWYTSWNSRELPLSSVNWSKYSSVIYAFATTTSDVNTIGLSSSDEVLLPEFVSATKLHNVHPILSIGGWTGSRFFSSAVATKANRTAFARAVMGVVSRFDLHGIEFDWEYPGRQGDGGNIVSKDDSTNFLSFLRTLRSQNGANNLIICAAVSIKPFIGPDGTPMSDVSGFAKVLSYIEIINYDVWGSWSSSVGPNAPLADSCASSPQGSAESAVKAWTSAGFPQKQIILGLATYGHSYYVDKDNAYDPSGKIIPYARFDNYQQPPRDVWDSTAGGPDECGTNVAAGVFDFWSLIDCGFLTKDGTAAVGIDYAFDSCSETPFVYNSKAQILVAYDDAFSFIAKGKYIKDAGLAGFVMWHAAGDSHDILLNAISSAVGNIP
ncbi:glycoside hydrolase [Lactifluus subvellereus]|nr:glycoside hydrolase [Lactifluus subvellereus]